MPFGDEDWETTLPSYLFNTEKGRIKIGLSQFFEANHHQKDKVYSNFYLEENTILFFIQGDIFNSIPAIEWDDDNSCYYTAFTPAMLVSNSCDISPDNNRQLPKEALFAPVIPLVEFIKGLEDDGMIKDQITSIINNLKHQDYSNIFYLPPNPLDLSENIVLLDKVYWHPSSEIQKKLADIKNERGISLDHFGFYLFIAKLSFHLCRVPEEIERRSDLKS
jgi:hypothetical protein